MNTMPRTDAVVSTTSECGTVATVTLNRPERLNAIDLPMWQALGDAFEALADRSPVEGGARVVVLRGAGGNAFAAGGDIHEFETVRGTGEGTREYDRIMRRVFQEIARCQAPVVAAIEGVCIGGGLELASQCDLRIANMASRFGVPINRLGMTMAYPEIEGIIRLVGPAHAATFLLEGRIIEAREALAIGLVNRVVPNDAFEDELEAMLAGIVKGAPLVNAWHKAFIRRLMDPTPLSATEHDACYRYLETRDYFEGVRAFRDKRKPEFKGC
ncbi:enoyl-CoA hydratase/isomerase family protein [Phaeovibrio sulfidiphilus]|uniref:Enoyl-CoA hydratase/isomerase family protein n=1 Tax=Phaeovibrio sulfidiphilus TaxID=1220600 RepID=A0A8J6YQG9_9PROT|nr:enoyl-CoA hydratase-related protein [Phaeovibrio sulfidiphilus]MBE1237841.1 enoyl-CoA hydratase/isomerase family protein [Phaeovibrio sulfidiphilus]